MKMEYENMRRIKSNEIRTILGFGRYETNNTYSLLFCLPILSSSLTTFTVVIYSSFYTS